MAFDIGKFAQILSDVSETDHGKESITYIDIGLLDGDKDNFYELRDLPELASNIQLCGLQQPIRVRKGEEGRYTIVSGHRRHGALSLLVSEGLEQFRSAPCIVESEDGSDAMRELRLIFANSSTRRLTDAELSQQAERVEMLLYQLEQEGVEFPGRMRDQVAAACKVSSTKLAELKVIRDKLQEPFLTQFQSGAMNTSAAYKLARIPEDIQRDIAEAVGSKKIIPGTGADNLLKMAEKYYDFAAKENCQADIGFPCSNVKGFLKATAVSQYSWQYCEGRCCCTCCRADQCSGACKAAKDEARERKAERELEKAKDEKRRQREQKKLRDANAALAQRLLKAADAAGLELTDKISSGYGARKISDLRKIADGTTEEYFYSSDAVLPSNLGALKLMAQQLDCSADYLLGLTEELKPVVRPEADAAAESAAFWKPLGRGCWPKEGELVLLSCENLMGGYQYQLARCVGGSDDQYPFIDPNDGLSCEEFEDFDHWLPLVERRVLYD